MESKKPIRRVEALQPFSREHHDGLLLSWKIRKGFQMNVALERIQKYCDWFWDNHLETHFRQEETELFPLLGNEHKLVQEALQQHASIKKLLDESKKDATALPLFADELEQHIRFEERVLFNEIQQQVSEEKLSQLTAHDTLNCEAWSDEFWN